MSDPISYSQATFRRWQDRKLMAGIRHGTDQAPRAATGGFPYYRNEAHG